MATITLKRRNLRQGAAKVTANDWDDLITVLNAIVTLVSELKTDLTDHVHGGVTAGAANTSAGAAITSATPDSLALVK